MRQLWLFLVKNHLIFLFVTLQIIGFSLLFSRSDYQRNKWLHATSFYKTSVDSKTNTFTNILDAKLENELLEQENLHLRILLEDALSAQNKLLKDSTSLDTTDNVKYNFVATTVVSNTLNDLYNHITIDVGKKKGVKLSDGIITSEGVIGKVVRTSNNYSLVMPLFHPLMRLNVQHQQSGYNGNLVWNGKSIDELQVENIPRNAEVHINDVISVNQFSKSFPDQSLVGTVTKIDFEASGNFYILTVKPFVDFRKLKHVYVAQRNDLDELLELEEEME